MPNLSQERAHLGRAERHIADGERRLTCQLLLIDRMRRQGQQVDVAEAMQRRLEEALAAWQQQRAEIIKTISKSINN